MGTKVTVEVLYYTEAEDTFTVHMDMPEAPCGGGSYVVDAVMLAVMLRTWGEPAEFVGRKFNIEF